MSLCVVGSIAFDSVSTPFGSVERELGGSAVHAALAGALFTEVRVVGPVGGDFGPDQYGLLGDRGVVTTDIEHFPDAQTFTWRGRYAFDMGIAHTEETHLNVFDGWRPGLSAQARDANILFLASMDPEIQAEVRAQWRGPKWAALDSIAYWIETKRDALIEAIRTVDIVFMDDQEVRALAYEPMLLNAAREIMSWGPQAVVVKHGEHGCSLLTRNGYFALPGYPLEEVADPSGSGDAFAGAFLGYLDLVPSLELNESMLRRGMTYGSVVASFCVADFGARRVARLTEREIEHRVADFKEMTHFEHVQTNEKRREPGGDPRRRRFEMPKPTAGTATYEDPGATGGTPSYGAPPPSRGTPSYGEPHGTPGTRKPPRHDRHHADSRTRDGEHGRQ